ncbi:MAG TPA: peptidoglycan DD-metalloendopeptidase family protein [Geminicoccus sp.]|uniref:M23 family metallopeptidase n=1 Tax=Geminicoccus sp. TaxID=2024832 RepID=UPI002E32E0FC|nr:peptidoglycan DD-metalloendopeptidase family protein [Geminicoccus sp.]HEX2526422.1 peptidoglycan DD-metalloendopeptidase family protein [Geminicoccus sp.]
MRSGRDGRSSTSWVALATAAGVSFAAGFGLAGAGFYMLSGQRADVTGPIEIARPQPPAVAPPAPLPALAAPTLFAQQTLPAGDRQDGRVAAGDLAPPQAWALAGMAPVDPDHAVAAPEQLLPPDHAVQDMEVEKGDTLIDIMLRAGALEVDAHAAIASLKGVYDPRDLRAGAQISIEVDATADGEIPPLKAITIPVAFAQELKVVRNPDGSFAAEKVQLELAREDVLAAGTITGSLYDSARATGMPAETIMRIVKLLSWDVDFQRDLQDGDVFEVLYDRLSTPDGSASRYDDVSFARLVTGGRDIALYRFDHKDGSRGWFDKDGHSIRKSLLRTPIDGARLSSRFGMRRHPVLGYSRMHKGVDFAASTGTPIYAAGDGVIEIRSRHQGYGNYVRIKHSGGYATAYGHMHRFAKQLKVGSKVKQGEVVGYVGSTGLSTGPHLHYEILQDGVQINPLSVKQAFAEELAGSELARFKAQRARVDALRMELAAPEQVAQKQG